ncbi:undecaprenyl-diphosphatase [Cryobacterium sp. MP_M5]|uniref:undecaprenyl-diphosphate phosphatase n=1 Tax=unclassified Cryobacterium TaxID=2649013 RepID=UPI0018CB58C7|nr:MULTISPECIES: undecaprenyl-diphosphate phosphatase [unclassified Cryobacterium]MBG6060024.1 undecaprenyl-diphosphatase [Cryobacterium sp. MP_M3]MEC5178454.1 undecaprenyl-diphosphatase [Cryobacterium sp. MP_M5]
MNLLQALILGIVEGVTEFLPVSSTGHLTIVEKLLGMKIDDAGITAFTAIIQVGAIVAVFVYFRSDIARLAVAWVRGLVQKAARTNPDYRLAWHIIIGSIPIGIVGFAAKDLISGGLRNLWIVVAGLVLWSIVMIAAERVGQQARAENNMTVKDALIIGVMQCIALIPGVSRSGATISAGLFRNFNRVAATRISFFLSIPALTAAGAYEAATQASAVSTSVGWLPTIVATIVSFLVAYAAIAWLLRLVAKHSITVFIGYRIGLATLVSILLITGVISAT